jgi:putative colanic acid biosynthesis acetyltransferase WcaF
MEGTVTVADKHTSEPWCYDRQIRVVYSRRQQARRLLWWIGCFLLIKCSLRPMYAWRRWVLRLFGAKVGENASIQRSARIEFPWNLEIGRYGSIGEEAWIYNLDKITIADYATVSQRVFLCTGSHDYTRPEFEMTIKPITIQRGVWIAADVYVGPGVTIGENAVIGARSVVVKDMPADMVCVGHPCVPIKPRVPVECCSEEDVARSRA